MIDTVGGGLPPSAERPTRPKVLVLPGLVAKRPSSLPIWEHVVRRAVQFSPPCEVHHRRCNMALSQAQLLSRRKCAGDEFAL